MVIASIFVIACGVLAILYGLITIRQVMASGTGNERMQEIAGAIQEGAQAYLNRQYRTIAIVGVVVAILVGVLLGSPAIGVGILVGAILSGAAGYIGRHVSVRANVRTTEAARTGMEPALSIAFKSGA
ncbi:MAG: sodium/proton-translocating pyrophosphatase, partial [Pseudomonadota bacterium]